jgi:two-component system osmolarity sensor histidine kinase EnvZ
MPGSLSLFARTGITLAIALALFMLFTVASMVNFILIPLAKQGAGDLAALMVLSAQTWVELPPETRPFLEQELMEEYQLKVTLEDKPLPTTTSLLPFLHFLEEALARRIGEPTTIRVHAENGVWYSADIPMGGRLIRISFPRGRIGARPPTAALLVIAAGGAVILLTTLLLVRRLTRPLASLCAASSRIGRGETVQPLPESGPRELATLTRRFNRMAGEIAELLSNRTTLFAGISHDLRTPITRMQLALEMLPANTDARLVQRLRHDLEQMNQLISDTLELAQGLGPREAQEVDLRDFLDSIIAGYRRSDADIDWRPQDCCLCSIDTLALRRVFVNLLDNALRYGGGRPVEVLCRCDETGACIRVLDRGRGIPEAEREAVFRPFYRLESSRSRSTGGSGLGLAIARQLCSAHGWTIEMLPREGGGTDARIRLGCSVMVS